MLSRPPSSNTSAGSVTMNSAQQAQRGTSQQARQVYRSTPQWKFSVQLLCTFYELGGILWVYIAPGCKPPTHGFSQSTPIKFSPHPGSGCWQSSAGSRWR